MKNAVRAIALAIVVVAGAQPACAEDATPGPPTPDQVLDALKRTIAWSQQAHAAMQAAKEAAVVLAAREDDRTIVAVLQRAFEAARAEATIAEQTAAPSASPATTTETPSALRSQRRLKLETTVRDEDEELARLRARVTKEGHDKALQAQIATLANRVALDRLRLELMTSLQQVQSSLTSDGVSLKDEIQALQETVPELAAASSKSSAPVAVQASAPAAPPPSTGTWLATHRLVALQRASTSLAQLESSTHALAKDIDARAERVRQLLRDRAKELRTLVGAPGSDATHPVAETEFRRELETLKQIGAALVPLRADAALVQRVESDVRSWERAVDRERHKALQDLGLGLLGLVIGLVVILIGALAWRIATDRYVRDPYRRRLMLRARKIVVAIAFALLVVFHFTSELTALVTALGFAAAGIAFALQNVILALAGYFSMMAPNGIRVGDRVSLQGPFGYVHGEVLEIGLVRLRLKELEADRLEPTGRIVVFPNSVVFTGSFFKDPTEPAKAA